MPRLQHSRGRVVAANLVALRGLVFAMPGVMLANIVTELLS